MGTFVLTHAHKNFIQVELLALLQYDDARIQEQTPFLSVDVEFNSILAVADVSLAAMAKVLQLHSSVRFYFWAKCMLVLRPTVPVRLWSIRIIIPVPSVPFTKHTHAHRALWTTRRGAR